MTIQEEKALLRKTMGKILSIRQKTGPLDMNHQPQEPVLELLAQFPQYQQATSLLAYASLPGELSVDQVILQALKAEKKVFLPKIFPKDCSMEFYALKNHLPYSKQSAYGSYGIREPISNLEKYEDSPHTIILIPGLAFTRTGHRLGRGKGFYDRFLAGLDAGNCTFTGVCHQWQIVEQIPTEETDIPLDFILTPEELINCKA